MPSRSSKTKLAALACGLAVPAAALAGCGGIPGNAVATVDGNEITKASFEHRISIQAKSSGQPAAAVPKPPDYRECVTAKRSTLPKPAKGQPKTTDEQLKTQCKSEYTSLKGSAMQQLIAAEWFEGEAEELDIKVSDADVKKQFETLKKQSFPKDADYQKFLKQSGQSQEDIDLTVRIDLLSTKIREKIVKGKDKVADAEIAKYYNENKERFAQPERRDLQLVLTKTEPKAREAKSRIDGGEKWEKVAKALSIDQQSKASGGKLPAVAKGQQDRAFDEAIFKSKKGGLVGPVKTRYGFYVFRVTGIMPATQQSQKEASATIKQLLGSQKQQKALDKFVKGFTKKWRSRTECRKAYATTDCKNGPKPTPTPAAPAPGQAPGQPQQQAPQPAPTQ